ncbi:MAG: leucyl/phenylalanyl-tRNA--protein transferase [Oligoflexia bacterium]|nr:leucyl/phenylalanyl-tRNA--protein transferase [Oligoflexia bacterium]
MPVYRIPDEHIFPRPSLAEPDGLLGIGGDLHPRRLLLGYANGIFPWYSQGQPILWFSPDPRYVLFPDQLKVQRSLKKIVRRGDYRVTLDTAFADVVRGCKERQRPGQAGTWITDDMEQAYNQLHAAGFAHSVESWSQDKLVGGLYGIGLGKLFSGESMFALAPNASKVAFVWLVRQLHAWDYGVIDCQVHTRHLERFGANYLSRGRYLDLIKGLISQDRTAIAWSFDPDFDPAV